MSFERIYTSLREALKESIQAESPETEPHPRRAPKAFGADDRYEVGVSPLWRAGSRARGLHITWHFGNGVPFCESLGREGGACGAAETGAE